MAEVNTIRQTVRRAKAEGLGVSETALRRWCKTGELPFIAVGNRQYISWSVLLKFLGVSSQEVEA